MKINNKKRQSAITKQKERWVRAWIINKAYEVLGDALDSTIIYGIEPKYKPEPFKDERGEGVRFTIPVPDVIAERIKYDRTE